MESISSSETLILIRSTRPHFPDDGILPSHRSDNLQSYNVNILLMDLRDALIGIVLVFIVIVS
jgi:hypothetical protein